MIIRLNEFGDIIQAITVGGDPSEPDCVEVFNVPEEIMSDIFSYKYIDGTFVKKDDVDARHVEEAKTHKIEFLSETCRRLIEEGIQVGDDHYSLSYTDQMNLSKLATQAIMSPSSPLFYHADGKLCRQYTPEEILTISQLGVAWVTYHTTYNNFAKAYIKEQTEFDDIRYFKYGEQLHDPDLESQMLQITQTTGVTFDLEIEDPFDYDSILHPQQEVFEYHEPEIYSGGDYEEYVEEAPYDESEETPDS